MFKKNEEIKVEKREDVIKAHEEEMKNKKEKKKWSTKKKVIVGIIALFIIGSIFGGSDSSEDTTEVVEDNTKVEETVVEDTAEVEEEQVEETTTDISEYHKDTSYTSTQIEDFSWNLFSYIYSKGTGTEISKDYPYYSIENSYDEATQQGMVQIIFRTIYDNNVVQLSYDYDVVTVYWELNGEQISGFSVGQVDYYFSSQYDVSYITEKGFNDLTVFGIY